MSSRVKIELLYGLFDQALIEAGFVPVANEGKKALGRDWNNLAPSSSELERRRTAYATRNIGVLAGTSLPNGNRFGIIDCDDDRLNNFICEAVGPVKSGKIGKKGVTVFVQVVGNLRNGKVLGPDGKPAVEFLIHKQQTILPPSIHPDGMRYRWFRKPLLDVLPAELPLLTEEREKVIRVILKNENAWAIINGGAGVKAHRLLLALTASGIAGLTRDHQWLARVIGELFHPEYKGNGRDEILGMLQSADAKGLGIRTGIRAAYDPGHEGPVPLGFTRDGLFALLDRGRQIIVVCSAQQLLSGQFLLGLAPDTLWEAQFANDKGFSAIAAGQALIAACRARGAFLPNRVRGRGIWREGDRLVINLAGTAESERFVYLCFDPIQLDVEANFDAGRLLRLLKVFNWRHAQDAMLLLGWLAVAPICGVLSWRPHLFVFGPPRSGKTTLHTIVRTIMQPLVLAADGSSSEAGIRQTLGPDSLPVVLDEFESDHNGAGLRQVMRLARSASSGDTPVLRGTPEGKAMAFSLSAIFFFAAVNPRGLSPADQSRIMMLELLMHSNVGEKARWIAEEEAYFRSLGPTWCSYMVARAHLISPAIELIEPRILAGDRRLRQNLSTLIGAGFVALHSRLPTEEEAEALVREYASLTERHADENDRDDAQECLSHLLSFPMEHYTLGHWLAVLHSGQEGERGLAFENAPKNVAAHDLILRLNGNMPGLFIMNDSPAMERVFRGTRWEDGAWKTALRKLPEAFIPKDPQQFSTRKWRCTGLPLEYVPLEPLAVPKAYDGETNF